MQLTMSGFGIPALYVFDRGIFKQRCHHLRLDVGNLAIRLLISLFTHNIVDGLIFSKPCFFYLPQQLLEFRVPRLFKQPGRILSIGAKAFFYRHAQQYDFLKRDFFL